MTYSMKAALACTVAIMGTAAAAETMTIGITQNNVGVDSYQTTYEQAFIAAAEADPFPGEPLACLHSGIFSSF